MAFSITKMSPKTDVKASQVIIFSLESLYDHAYPVKQAMSEVQKAYKELATMNQDKLIRLYTSATQGAKIMHSQRQTPPYKDTDRHKVELFFSGAGAPKPSGKRCQEFLALYDKTYRNNQRVMPGVIETMAKLRKKGHAIAILVRGTGEYDLVRCESLGIRHLVDFLLTEDEASMVGPKIRIFGNNAESMDLPQRMSFRTKTSMNEDIRQALADRVTAVVYEPDAQERHKRVCDRNVPVICDMTQLLNLVDTVCAVPLVKLTGVVCAA